MTRLPTEEEFLGWNSLPVTDTLREFARAKVAFLKDSWAAGVFTTGELEKDALKNAEMIGALQAYAEIAELDYEAIITELGDQDGSIRGPGTAGSGSGDE